MAKFSVCRIYKVTLWLNFSYNYSVNLLQILHLYLHPNRPCHGFDAILTREVITHEKLQFLYENVMSNNFRRTVVLKKKIYIYIYIYPF